MVWFGTSSEETCARKGGVGDRPGINHLLAVLPDLRVRGAFRPNAPRVANLPGAASVHPLPASTPSRRPSGFQRRAGLPFRRVAAVLSADPLGTPPCRLPRAPAGFFH